MAKKKHPGGRPKAFDDASMRRKFLLLLKNGISRPDACRSVGVSTPTLYRQIRESEELANDVLEAETEGKTLLILTIYNAVKAGDVKAAMWMLERKHWKEFARRSPDAVTPDQLAAVFMRLSAQLVAALPKECHAKVRAVFEAVGMQAQEQGKRSADQ